MDINELKDIIRERLLKARTKGAKDKRKRKHKGTSKPQKTDNKISSNIKNKFERLQGRYKIKQLDPKSWQLQVKNKEDFPYRIKYKNGMFNLSQAHQEMSYLPLSWQTVKKSPNIDEIIDRIISRHNKATEYMDNWKKIS